MKTLKNLALVVIVAVLGIVGLVGCGDGTKTFTVSFDSDSGTAVPAQKIDDGKKATEPTSPTKDNDVAGLYEGTPPDYTFDGWYNGTTAWDFTANTVTSNITLKAKWTAPTPIDLNEIEGDNVFQQAFSYAKNNPNKKYTFLLDKDIEVNEQVGEDEQSSVYDLSLVGIAEPRTITLKGNSFFMIRGSNTNFTLGKNIILKSELASAMIFNGFTMLAGSKITGGSYGIAIEGGNKTTIGGIITGNDVYDVMLNSNASCTLFGTAEIGNIRLRAFSSQKTVINIASDWTGTVGKIDLDSSSGSYNILLDMDTVIGYWEDKAVVQAVDGHTLTTEDVARFPLGVFFDTANETVTQPISDTHKLKLDTTSNVIKLVKK